MTFLTSTKYWLLFVGFFGDRIEYLSSDRYFSERIVQICRNYQAKYCRRCKFKSQSIESLLSMRKKQIFFSQNNHPIFQELKKIGPIDVNSASNELILLRLSDPSIPVVENLAVRAVKLDLQILLCHTSYSFQEETTLLDFLQQIKQTYSNPLQTFSSEVSHIMLRGIMSSSLYVMSYPIHQLILHYAIISYLPINSSSILIIMLTNSFLACCYVQNFLEYSNCCCLLDNAN